MHDGAGSGGPLRCFSNEGRVSSTLNQVQKQVNYSEDYSCSSDDDDLSDEEDLTDCTCFRKLQSSLQPTSIPQKILLEETCPQAKLCIGC